MADKLTDSQIKGVTITDRDICVVAGPGSGKTFVLVERFVNLVTSRKAGINEILTITFTEKAANEMKIRVARSFEKRGMDKERQEIEFAYLSTIHGFCARLLRENAIEAGLDPLFRVTDELEAGRLKEKSLEETLNKWAEEKTLDIFLNRIYWKQIDSKKSRLKSFKENLIQLYENIRNASVPVSKTAIIDDLSSKIINSYNKAEVLINKIKDIYSENNLIPKTREKVEYILEKYNASNMQKHIDKLYVGKEKQHTSSDASSSASPPVWLQGRNTGENIRTENSAEDNLTLILLNNVRTILASINLQVSKNVKETLRSLQDALNKLLQLLVEDYASETKIMMKDFLVNFDIAYSERKKYQGFIDFTDLEIKTIELLENKGYIASEIKRKFKYILVDEFQDISRLQKKLIDLIRSEGNCFIVGDAKQSIYGFRNADVEIFQDIQNDIDPESLISMNENFRSRPQILDFINHIFNTLWTYAPTGIEEDHIARLTPSTDSTQQLKAGAGFTDKPFPSIEVILAEGKDKTEGRKWESMEIAKRIKEIVDKGEIKTTNKREQERNITYGDIAILFRSTTDIKLYEDSLSQLDIPYYVVSGRGFYNTSEITDLINLLKVIESPLDEINLAAVLKSPFVGIDDDTLFWLTDHVHRNNKKILLYQVLDVVGSIKEIKEQFRNKIIQFKQFFSEMRNIKPRTSLWKLISLILEKTEFQSKMLLFSNGKQRYANLLKIVEICKNREDFEPLTLKEFIEILEYYKFREIREAEAAVESEEDNVVRLITTHSAKGLEFPVVIVADTDRDNSKLSGYFVYSREHGISFKILNPSTNEAEEPLSYKCINDETKEKELQESKRLLFVAVTRAQEHLIISGGINKSMSMGDNDKGNWQYYISSSLNLDPDPEENSKIIKLIYNDGQNSSDTVEIKYTRVNEENKPSLQSVFRSNIAEQKDKTKDGNKIKLLTRHRMELSTCKKIITPSPSKKIEKTGKNILSTIKHNVEIDNCHYVYSVTEILKFHFCPRLYYLNSILGLQGINNKNLNGQHYIENEDKNGMNDDEIPGHELGNIVHRVFKKYTYPDENLKECIKKELKTHRLDTNQKCIDLISNWVRSFYNADIGNEVASSKQQKRETSFIFNYQDNLIRGQIDLFFINSNGSLKIIDYKTNDITIDNISEKVKLYKLQMQLYTRALEAIYKKNVDQTVLYFLIPDKAVAVDTTEDACKELNTTLNNFFTAHKNGDFKKFSDHKCKWCEYETICK